MYESFIIIIRLLLSALFGGLIGFEREAHNRPAGFRTHILVTIGSSLLMIVSKNIEGGDTTRIAAQVVSGIGFLGAGTILRTGSNIEGLTTAASIWVCSAVGLAIGGGFYLEGLVVTIIVYFFLKKISPLERLINKKSHKTIKIIGEARPGFIGEIGTLFGRHNINIVNVSIHTVKLKEDVNEEIIFVLKFPLQLNIENLLEELHEVKGIRELLLSDEIIEIDQMQGSEYL